MSTKVESTKAKSNSGLKIYLSLLKSRITINVVLTTFIGFYIGEVYQNKFIPDGELLFTTLLSTALVCAGVCCLNHVIEWRDDLKMERTKSRPIPSGQISPFKATVLGGLITMLGLVWMLKGISVLMASGAFATGVLYLAVYTPMKKISWYNTSIGAIPGALPILGGWVAAKGGFGIDGWLLFAILFFWQHPHFYAIAWNCRKDYEQAGYKMITIGDEKGDKTFTHSLIHTVLLVIFSFTLVVSDFRAGVIYLVGMIILNIWFSIQVWYLYRERSVPASRRLVLASVVYLSTFFALFFVDQNFYLKVF